MNKLWVYGCSFSWAFQDLQELPPIETDQGWPQIVANTIGYKYIDRAEPGYGLNHILRNLNEDIAEERIDKNDVIILSPSYFQRLTFPEIDEQVIDGLWTEFHAKYGIENHKIISLNILRFYLKIKTLRELGYNIYGWCWSMGNDSIPGSLEYLNKISDYLIYAPNKRMFWEDWMLENPDCMLIPGKRLSEGRHTGDTHFSIYGHKVAANHISNNIQWH